MADKPDIEKLGELRQNILRLQYKMRAYKERVQAKIEYADAMLSVHEQNVDRLTGPTPQEAVREAMDILGASFTERGTLVRSTDVLETLLIGRLRELAGLNAQPGGEDV